MMNKNGRFQYSIDRIVLIFAKKTAIYHRGFGSLNSSKTKRSYKKNEKGRQKNSGQELKKTLTAKAHLMNTRSLIVRNTNIKTMAVPNVFFR